MAASPAASTRSRASFGAASSLLFTGEDTSRRPASSKHAVRLAPLAKAMASPLTRSSVRPSPLVRDTAAALAVQHDEVGRRKTSFALPDPALVTNVLATVDAPVVVSPNAHATAVRRPNTRPTPLHAHLSWHVLCHRCAGGSEGVLHRPRVNGRGSG